VPDPWPLSRWGLPEDRTVYLCPQSLFKIHPAFDDVLAGILRGDPDGLVVLANAKVGHWGRLLMDRLRRTAPDVAGRIVLLPKQPYDAFLRLMQAAPVMLDSWPFGGGNTTLEAFAMGTPVVTLPDTHLRGRLTLGFYRRMGYEDLVATSPDDYVARALALGRDAEARAMAHATIAARSNALYEDAGTLEDFAGFFEEAVAGNPRSGTVDSGR
jgi:predicted O-linked N-acetylglucosamine transferase (SPINDLY family)